MDISRRTGPTDQHPWRRVRRYLITAIVLVAAFAFVRMMAGALSNAQTTTNTYEGKVLTVVVYDGGFSSTVSRVYLEGWSGPIKVNGAVKLEPGKTYAITTNLAGDLISIEPKEQ